MPHDTKITLYYGPLNWFQQRLTRKARRSLMEVVFEFEDTRREIRVVTPGQEVTDKQEETKLPRPGRVVAESGDYASLNEHVVTNFVGLVRSLRPKHLYLHNPPVQVHAQLERAFPNIRVERHVYPAVTPETLIRFQNGFGDHLVGQEDVRDALLAAVYPLTRPGSAKPVVVMFYGPSGVGKTETARFINDLLGGRLLRKQFSMFHSDKFASYVFGGHHSEASFARDLLDRESGVILIDEFDKANAVFHSAFYELFDGGVFEDKNYRVEVGPALIVCTSNYSSEKEIRDALGDALYSRFDALIGFEPLTSEQIVKVLDRVLDDRFARLSEEELTRIDREGVGTRLAPLANQPGNVRKLTKLVDGVISLLLVRSMLEEQAAGVSEMGPLAATSEE
ncbi:MULTISPECIES: AAA family ATPase [unclassified Agromyces]|uniref:AAA family ATPase n=1 Tax=unclassified Agromyces TaxID=2639701 RepID=UPI0030144CAF